jgi:hypothetical protein
MTEARFLSLRAESADDLQPLSALVQDMALMAGDVGYDARARRLLILGNRFRWEAPDPPTRMRAMLRFEFVDRVQRRLWPVLGEEVFSLLAIEAEEAADGRAILTLAFSGGPTLRLETEVIDVTLVDLAGPWEAVATPRHEA